MTYPPLPLCRQLYTYGYPQSDSKYVYIIPPYLHPYIAPRGQLGTWSDEHSMVAAPDWGELRDRLKDRFNVTCGEMFGVEAMASMYIALAKGEGKKRISIEEEV